VHNPQEIPWSPIQRGEVLAGKYRVERAVGVGGMGAVFVATHLLLEEPVAIKVLLPTQLHRPDAAPRFLREARAASKIKSDHVARVLDVGTLESGLPFLVMEFLEGEDLSARLERQGPRPLAEAAGWLLQVCEAMAEAHSKGIVHRDLKPSNLFLQRLHDGSERVKILDFGISKVSGDLSDGFLTHSRAVLGSPFYMAPEQMSSSGKVDGRADIWSLGCVLFETLTGTPPFLADDVTVLVARVLHEPPPSLLSLRPELPPAIEPVLARCLAKDPLARFPDVAALAAALAPFAPLASPGVPHLAPAPPDRDTLPAPEPSPAASLATSSERPPSRLRWLPALGGALLLVGLAAALGLSRSSPPPAVPPPRPLPVSVGVSSDPPPAPCALPSVVVASAEPLASASAAPVPSPSAPRKAGKAQPAGKTPPPGLPHDRD
jgi:serine/threonine-protein kinase